jgi:hypothetical protein
MVKPAMSNPTLKVEWQVVLPEAQPLWRVVMVGAAHNEGYPNENPGGQPGGYNFMTEPGYQFRFEEGQRALDRGAAARGGLLSGGYGRKAIRYGQGFASNEYANVYNRIANIAGLGQTAGGQAGQTALHGAGMMGNAAGNAGFARASGYAAQGDIWGNAISSAGSFAQDMWGDKLSGWWKNRGSGDGEIGGGSGGVPFRGGMGSPSDIWTCQYLTQQPQPERPDCRIIWIFSRSGHLLPEPRRRQT